MIYSIGSNMPNQQNFGAINIVCKNPENMKFNNFFDCIDMFSSSIVKEFKGGNQRPVKDGVFNINLIKNGFQLIGKDEKAERVLFERLKIDEQVLDSTITMA